MKSRINPRWAAFYVISAVFSLMIAGTALKAANTRLDDREAVHLNDEERQFVLVEMQNYVVSLQQLISALSTNDMQGVATAARPMGMQAMQNAPATLMAKMPGGFRSLGMPTHMAFDQIAQSAESGVDASSILSMLSKAMNNCVACHASYRIERAAPQK
ncbi:MAG: hypothetical protein OES09_16085 [Gammaproteobacteria bacterium]|nr:hypothetical protein [Gammaproteobacteria bacterium]